MAAYARTFTDLDFNFTANPVTGDVSVKTNENAIKQSIRTLVLTNNYERLFHPEIGSQVNSLLFDQYNPTTAIMLKVLIENTIINFEPRVELLEVKTQIKNDNQSIDVRILFRIINTQRPIYLDITLRRTR
jgi:phage baseplate assembly protein W